MGRAARPLLLRIVAALTLLGSVGHSAAQPHPSGPNLPPENFIILSPQLRGDSALTVNVTNLLRLQISATFREADTGTRGRMVWGEYQLPESTHEAAVRNGLSVDAAAHLVLWGDSFDMLDGVVVQAFLSVTPRLERRRNRPEVWSLPVRQSDGETRYLSIGLPRRLYRFPPILIPSEAAAAYPTILGLPIYSDRSFSEKIGSVGDLYRAYEYSANAALLNSNGVTGWVSLPHVTEEQNIVAEFSSAVMRLCRGDLTGAEQLLLRVLEREETPVDVQTDSYLLMGLIEGLRGGNGLKWFARAIELSPLDRMSAAYLIMARVAATLNARDDQPARAHAALIDEIERRRRLFSEGSPWLRLAESFAGN